MSTFPSAVTAGSFQQIHMQHICPLVKIAQDKQQQTRKAEDELRLAKHASQSHTHCIAPKSTASTQHEGAKPEEELKAKDFKPTKSVWWKQMIVSQSHLAATRTRVGGV